MRISRRERNASPSCSCMAGPHKSTRSTTNYCATHDKVHVYDLHVTILHLLGIDHERLTYHYGGGYLRMRKGVSLTRLSLKAPLSATKTVPISNEETT